MAHSIYLRYHNSISGTSLEAELSLEEALGILDQFSSGCFSVIADMPSGLGLDFHGNDDLSDWVEFWHPDALKSATVDIGTAKKILERAYQSESIEPPTGLFADLIETWDY